MGLNSCLQATCGAFSEETVMQFLAQNWFYILALILFVAMHLAGFGCGHRHRADSGHLDPDRLERSRSEDRRAQS